MSSKPYISLTEKQKQNIKNLYLSGETLSKIGAKYSLSVSSISRILKKINVKTRNMSDCHRKYFFNENYFDSLDSEEKNYFFGFLMADGTNDPTTRLTRIRLQSGDEEILNKFKKLINYTGKLYSYSYQKTSSIELSMCSSHMSKKLSDLGMVKNKTIFCDFPKIKKKYFWSFLRGYFDGDGCATWSKKHKSTVMNFCGTELFCKKLQEILKKDFDINSKLFKDPKCDTNSNFRKLQINGNQQILFMLIKIYGKSDIFLDRKYKKSIKIINNILKLKKRTVRNELKYHKFLKRAINNIEEIFSQQA